MSTPLYQPADKILLPPPDAEVFTTACDYCVVACGYKVYRWPARGPQGGPKAKDNAFGVDFPTGPFGWWVSPNQTNQVRANGRLYNIAVVPDTEAKAVNPHGSHSIRGGCIAQKVYNPHTPTADRLKHPMVRVHDILIPVSWDFALDVMAEVSKHVIQTYGESAWAMKYFSYQYFENTYALTKLAFRSIGTPAVAHHDHPAIVNSVPGWVDIGYDIFSASYEDLSLADCILISGTDPFESKTVTWNEWIVKGINGNQTQVIMAVPRRTQGVAYAEAHGGLWLDLFPGSDTAVHMAIARIILENGWEDKDFIRDWTNNQWETDSGFGQGTRNTPWQWRTTWGKLQTKGFEDWKQWIYNQPESDPHAAAKFAGLDVNKLYRAAEMMAKPRPDGSRPKTSIGIEKGNYWSNNYLNTASIGNLGVIVGAGGRPGRVVTRLGGHQRGGRSGGRYPGIKSPYKFPGRRRHRMDLDRWVDAGHVRLAYCVGTTWVQAMCGTSSMEEAFRRLVKHNPHQVSTLSKQGVIDTLKQRADSGGMVVVNQEIYPIDPIGTQYADIVLPAATWGEENFTRCNGERRIRLYQKFYDPPGEAKPDWQIVAMLAKKMGFEGYDWKDSNDVFEESCRFSRGKRTDYNVLRTVAKRKGMKAYDLLKTYGTQGLQCPLLLDGDQIVETKRLHDFNRKLPATGPEGPTVVNKALTAFKTHTGKLNLMKTPWNIWSDFYEFVKPREDELWVGNGRINEVWQSGFDDVERRPYITQRWPFNFLEIHPDDAKPRGIESGDLVSVESQRVPVQTDFNMGVKSDDMWFSGLMKRGHIKLSSGQFTAVAIVTPGTKKGVVYTNHLDKQQPVNALAPRVPDPLTMNYRFKMTVGKVVRLGESPYKHDLSQMSLKRRDIGAPPA
ncbi:arsenate reductase (azurin) large subunit [Candidatus Entotheonella palauensis]|uniref:arsenate reductase (azurin) large subunit n=1 Tax=Candidatus Entotheonella palauensis TaxID=93172 RepID=UPI000B7CB0E3|nr:arsenate reductase (azurin) large subunit [Candidatus Entotheonella palauensis]